MVIKMIQMFYRKATLFYNEKIDQSADDGIRFQWGEKYIRSDQVTPSGGKYWRQNEDGTITRFSPPDLRFKCIVGTVVAHLGEGKRATKKIIVDKDNYTIRFKDKSECVAVFTDLSVTDDDFWSPRGVKFELDIPVIKCHISSDIKEWTYSPV